MVGEISRIPVMIAELNWRNSLEMEASLASGSPGSLSFQM